MMAINYAHLVMLAAQGIVSPSDAHALREALDGVSQDAIRDVKYDGTCEDLFFYVERLIIQACGEDVAGRLHTARSRNDIDMTMYRMRQREFVLGLLAATLRAAPLAARPRRPASRHDSRRSHAHAAGAADDRRALPARGRRTARARCVAAQRRVRAHESQSARRLRHHRHRVSHRPAVDRRSPRLLRADRQYLRQHRHGRLPPRERVGRLGAAHRPRPLRAGPAALVHLGVRLRPIRRRVRAVQQHHAAEAQSGRDRARARHRQQGARSGAGDRDRRPQHAVRRHRRHRGRLAAAGVFDVPRRDAGGQAGGRRDDDGRVRRRCASKRAPATAGRR